MTKREPILRRPDASRAGHGMVLEDVPDTFEDSLHAGAGLAAPALNEESLVIMRGLGVMSDMNSSSSPPALVEPSGAHRYDAPNP